MCELVRWPCLSCAVCDGMNVRALYLPRSRLYTTLYSLFSL
jgi:hypothetical protein